MIHREKNILPLIKIAAESSRLNLGICFILTIIEGLTVLFMMVTVGGFIDSVKTLTSSEPKTESMVIYLLLTGVCYLYRQLSPDIRRYGYSLLEDNLRRKYRNRIIEEQFTIDYAVFESSATQDLLSRVTKDMEGKIVALIRSINTAVLVLIQVFGVLIAAAYIKAWVGFVYLLVMIPAVFFTFKNGRVIYEEEKKVAFVTRQMDYLSEILADRQWVNERNLFGFTSWINEKFLKAHTFRSNYNTKVLAKETSSSMMVNIAGSVAAVFMIFILAHEVPSGALSVGMFISISGSMIGLSKLVSFQSSELILEFSKHYEYGKDLRAFKKLKRKEILSEGEQKEDLSFNSLEIKDLWFRYGDSGEYILKGINLNLYRGKAYSLVGLNGAGKSTLVKIIMGLYKDYEGTILLNGRDLRTYEMGGLRKVFSMVSQDFAKYYVSLRDNISFGDSEADIEKVVNFMELEKLIEELPGGERCKLGKIYEDGCDVSGGQWQRIAIARALYAESSFMIMDEPTASLSPTAESKIYSSLMKVIENKTLLMITHRLGSTKITHEIIVLHKGEIVEKGTHERLMQKEHIYAQLYRKQEEMYVQ